MPQPLFTRRQALRAAALVASAAALAACQVRIPPAIDRFLRTNRAKVDQSGAVAAKVDKAKAVLSRSLWVVQERDLFPAYNELLRARLSAFSHDKGWTLRLSSMSEFAVTAPETEAVAAAVQAGSAPDLIVSHTLPVLRLRALNCLENVTPLVAEIEAQWGQSPGRALRDFRADGDWWAVPLHQRSEGGWYRRDVWEGAGVDIQAIRTYPELLEKCLQVSDPKRELYGWGITPGRCQDGEYFLDRLLTGWGAKWQDETGQYVLISSPETVEALGWLVEAFTKPTWVPALPPDIRSWTDPANNEAYLAGKLAYTQSSGFLLAQALLTKNSLADVTRFHPAVGGPKLREFSGLSSSAWLVIRDGANLDAAQETIRHFMLNLEPLDALLTAAPGFALPSYAKLWAKATAIQHNPIAAAQEAPGTDPQGIVPWLYPGHSTPAMEAARNADILHDMVEAALGGTLLPEAIQSAQRQMVALFKQFGLPG